MAKQSIEYPVEFYDLVSPKGANTDLVAVPFYAYKVFAPPPRQRDINMFQKAILGIMQIASYTTEKISSYLKLDRDLILLVQAELAAYNLIDGNGTVTTKGKKALHQESWDVIQDQDDYTVGYIYQDPWTKKFLPRFNTLRKFADIVTTDGSTEAQIITGTKGAPKKDNFVLCDPDAAFDNPPKSPSRKEIFEIIRKHTVAADYPDTELVSKSNAKVPIGLQKIALLDPEPQRTFLVTFLYASDVSSAIDDWRALDPLGLGESNGMKTILEVYLREDQRFAKRVDKLLGRQKEDWQKRHKENRQEILNRAKRAIQEILGLHNLSEVMEQQLLEFEFHYQEFRIVGEENAMPITAQKVLERMMREIADIDKDIFRRVRKRIPDTHSREDIAFFLETAAFAAGATEFPEIYAKSKPNQITAWPLHSVSLRPMVAATLIAAHDKADHTFTKMVRAEPQLLRFIADASMLRDTGAHYGASDDKETDHYEQMHQEMYQIITAYINATRK